MLGAIKDLVAKGAVVQVEPTENQFTSTIFLVEKRNGNGQYRPVINLKALNRFVECTPFKMESLQVAKGLLQPGDYMMKLDLKDAYYTVPVHSEHWCYLRFIYQSKLYEFRCLPFGLSSAPRAFTKILKPVAALLRSLGVRVVFYLDDILLLRQNKDELWKIFHQVVDLLQNLGFTVKREKCSPLPTQQLIFLGALLNSVTMNLSLPQEKLSAITMTAQEILHSHEVSLRTLSTLLGRMNHASQTGLWMAPLHYRSLQRDQIKALHSSSNPSQLMKITLSPSSIDELRWWTSPNIQTFNGQSLQTCPIEMVVSTDASLRGWGATWPGTTIGGQWLPEEAQLHINLLELKAAYLALLALFKSTTPVPQHILLQMDNSTAVAYINKRGGTRSHTLSMQATDLWAAVLSAGSWVTAKHIPGTSNEVADTASRQFDSHSEWKLHTEIFQRIVRRYYRPLVDLFASRINNQLPQYVSRYPDPGAVATDAFLCDWNQRRSWIFPPVVLIPRILRKLSADKATALILAPHWKGQPWFPTLLDMLVDYPRQLPQQPGLIRLPFDPEREHPLHHKLHLTVWPVSGKASEQEAFRKRLQTYCYHLGAKPPKSAMQGHGRLGPAGVLNGVSVPLLLL
jgi:hypothetical protein